MALISDFNGIIVDLNKRIDKILSLDIEKDLVREIELGKNLSFSSYRFLFENVFNALAIIRRFDLTKLPIGQLGSLHSQSTNIENSITAIRNFDANISNPMQVRDSHATSLEQNFETMFPNFAYVAAISQLNVDLVKQKKEIDQLFTNASQNLKEIESILNKSREATAKIGITEYETVFLAESEKHELASRKWLAAVATLGALTLAGTISLLFLRPELTSTSDLVQFTFAKVVVLTIAFYGLSLCIRNDKAHRHNSVVNKHRQNALKTFEMFVKSTDDQQTKNAILLEVTHSIFSNQNSGYLQTENESDVSNKVIEIFRDSNSKS